MIADCRLLRGRRRWPCVNDYSTLHFVHVAYQLFIRKLFQFSLMEKWMKTRNRINYTNLPATEDRNNCLSRLSAIPNTRINERRKKSRAYRFRPLDLHTPLQNPQNTQFCSYQHGSNVYLIYAIVNRRNKSAQWSVIGMQNTCWWIQYGRNVF